MQNSHEEISLIRIEGQPPVTPLVLNKITKWVDRVKETQQYEPFIKLKKTATVGKGSKVFNPESYATHETLSILETNLLRVLDFLPNVISIKTQYPLLPITNTLLIAQNLGVKHPSYTPKGKNILKEFKINQAVVMTTDFVIDYYDEEGEVMQCALALKLVNNDAKFSDKEKRDQNIKNKLNIEAIFWKQSDREWRLVTSAMPYFDEHFTRNLLEAESRNQLSIPSQVIDDVQVSFKRWLDTMPRACFSVILSEIALFLDIPTGMVRVAFWKLIWQQRLPVDISQEIIFNRPLPRGVKKWTWQ
ncbi:TnsA endonuclease N-terminal domain-containing protein [Alishewanella sp. HL-SH05]|uniref:TnsA endonuclease N-terminal domain-containing protein n=1 Tax=Alishewanella sp. HL-SH05 TaxID=3461145 RepID=UPI00404392B0